jgi:hypothetical protein
VPYSARRGTALVLPATLLCCRMSLLPSDHQKNLAHKQTPNTVPEQSQVQQLLRQTAVLRTARFSVHKFYVLATQRTCVFCVDLRTNSDYFPIQHELAGFYNRDGVCLLRGMDWIFMYTPKAQWLLYVPPGLTFTNSTFCPHSVFMCFVWISEQTAIISLYSIN